MNVYMSKNLIKILKLIGLYLLCLILVFLVFIIDGNLYVIGTPMSRLVRIRLIVYPFLLTVLVLGLYKLITNHKLKNNK